MHEYKKDKLKMLHVPTELLPKTRLSSGCVGGFLRAAFLKEDNLFRRKAQYMIMVIIAFCIQ